MSAPISAIKPHVSQDRLWDWVGDRELVSLSDARTAVGEFFEEAARVVFGADRHQTDARCYCPDLSIGPRRYLENKSVGRHRECIVFKHRLERDAQVVADGAATLTYVFWLHDVEVGKLGRLSTLRAALASSAHTVLVVPFERLMRAVRRMTPRRLGYHAHDTESDKAEAYRLTWPILSNLAKGGGITMQPALVHGHGLRPVELRGADLSRVFRPLTQAERDTAESLLGDLQEHRLTVELAPAPSPRHHGHQVRVVCDENPAWYRALCRTATSRRRRQRNRRVHDTDIRRAWIERALQRLSNGVLRHPWDFRLLPIVRAHAPGF